MESTIISYINDYEQKLSNDDTFKSGDVDKFINKHKYILTCLHSDLDQEGLERIITFEKNRFVKRGICLNLYERLMKFNFVCNLSSFK